MSADAFMRDYEVFFVADAMAAYGLAHHAQSAEYVSNLCASVLTTRAALAALPSIDHNGALR
jgi:bifunctional isochorismate lyase/aryl carrier protein